MTKIAGVIDTLVSAGANEIGGINFMVTQASKALDEARTKAVADARRKAEIYAKAAGVTLGDADSTSAKKARRRRPCSAARSPRRWPARHAGSRPARSRCRSR